MDPEKTQPLLAEESETGIMPSDVKKATAPATSDGKPKINALHASLIIATWMIISTVVILWNASILKTNPFPITLSCGHMLFQTVACKLLMRYAPHLMGVKPAALPLPASAPSSPKAESPSPRSPTFPSNAMSMSTSSNYTWYKTILPIGILFAASLVLSNAAYLFLSVPYIQMLKAGSPIAVMITSFAFGLKAFSWKLVGIIVGISTGVLLASLGEGASFNAIGFGIQIVAIMVEATRLSLIQLLMQGAGLTPMTSLNAFAPVCFLTLAVLILPIEGVAALQALPRLGWSTLLANAALTFALNISSIYLVAISSLVLSLSKVAKDIALVVGAVLLMGHGIGAGQVLGYGIALAGMLAYKFYG